MKLKIFAAGMSFAAVVAVVTMTSSGVFAEDKKIEVNTEKKEVFVPVSKDKSVGVFGQGRGSEPTRENPKGEVRGVVALEDHEPRVVSRG